MANYVRYNSGHGKSDSGAVGTYKGKTIYERDIAENFMKDLVAYQKQRYVGMTISFGVEKPNGDFPKNSNGTYNTKAYGIGEGGYYSFHLNASGGNGHGTETWYWKTYGDKRARVVNDVLDNYFADRDVKLADTNQDGYADFYILRECGFDTIVELAFVDNENDMDILFSKWDDIVKAVGDAIAEHEGWTKKEGEEIEMYKKLDDKYSKAFLFEDKDISLGGRFQVKAKHDIMIRRYDPKTKKMKDTGNYFKKGRKENTDFFMKEKGKDGKTRNYHALVNKSRDNHNIDLICVDVY